MKLSEVCTHAKYTVNKRTHWAPEMPVIDYRIIHTLTTCTCTCACTTDQYLIFQLRVSHAIESQVSIPSDHVTSPQNRRCELDNLHDSESDSTASESHISTVRVGAARLAVPSCA